MRALLAVLLALLPTAALAHTGVGDASGLAHGFMHPVGGFDHLLAMVAVGILAFAMGGRALVLVPLSFVLMMVGGFALGASGVTLPWLELGIAASGIAILGAVLFRRRLPAGFAMALVGVFGVFHGVAHGLEMPATASGFAYAFGFVTATALLHVGGIVLAFAASRTLRAVARR
jgi:urease accessory protein